MKQLNLDLPPKWKIVLLVLAELTYYVLVFAVLVGVLVLLGCCDA